ncbi:MULTISPECIES: type II toxin-antitoxin system VapC family toxin [unclassified Crossiella]|uniref:type II toxin-antitoxin system VapC family toxin n=1 Tax=unclassified Crossiella TaxID=2620835 RepID=UPI001FFF05E1|nr:MULTISPECIES: type II toxin-antitoxin system VapC family toxin [unclassified Crossiella]MCK2237936.1 type II toxin-antitoxin system VapC family toxin [Crossiella sp. S99.2]MCK2259170.1 type II toxin-antitoxin system VapC family toxin [Crossiella sp. S99.1]
MIIDTSAIVAILNSEPDAPSFAKAIQSAAERRISAATYVELAAVVERTRDPVTSRLLDDLLARMSIEIMPVTADQALIARRAYWDYGKGSGHPAGLNFGDCFSYALAREHREPLLFKGNDFVHTDVMAAL